MSQRLNREGFHCETAATENEAIQRLQEGGYESLISDIHMEGNVQLEFVARVAATAAGLPVIVLTGYPTVETAARAVGLRVTAYLTKPPDLGTLCSSLREAVHDYRATRRLRDGWQRLQDWSAELERLRSVFEQSATNDRADALRGYVQLSLRNLAIWLVELDQLMTAEDAKSTVSREVETQEFLTALRHTVTVLEGTKGQFKSRELGELRKELVAVLDRSTPSHA